MVYQSQVNRIQGVYLGIWMVSWWQGSDPCALGRLRLPQCPRRGQIRFVWKDTQGFPLSKRSNIFLGRLDQSTLSPPCSVFRNIHELRPLTPQLAPSLLACLGQIRWWWRPSRPTRSAPPAAPEHRSGGVNRDLEARPPGSRNLKGDAFSGTVTGSATKTRS